MLVAAASENNDDGIWCWVHVVRRPGFKMGFPRGRFRRKSAENEDHQTRRMRCLLWVRVQHRGIVKQKHGH